MSGFNVALRYLRVRLAMYSEPLPFRDTWLTDTRCLGQDNALIDWDLDSSRLDISLNSTCSPRIPNLVSDYCIVFLYDVMKYEVNIVINVKYD